MFWPFHPFDGLTMVALLDEQFVEQTRVTAKDLLTGEMRPYTVFHRDDTIEKVKNADGIVLRRHAPQFTEVVEAFHIDRNRGALSSPGKRPLTHVSDSLD